MEAVLGHPFTDKPVLCFSSNQALAALVKQGTTPCMWESKARLALGMETVLKMTAGQEDLMDLLGKNVQLCEYFVQT
jgi:hypothetical protein